MFFQLSFGPVFPVRGVSAALLWLSVPYKYQIRGQTATVHENAKLTNFPFGIRYFDG